MKDFLDFYKHNFSKSILNKLIGINIIVFIVSLLIPNVVLVWFLLPTEIMSFLIQPWSIVTSMFLHSGFSHIFWNMLWLWWMGTMLYEAIGSKTLLKLYLTGGLISGLGLLVYGALFGISTYALGASGAISTIMTAALFMKPNQKINVFGFNLKMKWIAWGLTAFSIFGLGGCNAGGDQLVSFLLGLPWASGYGWADILDNAVS
jgi:membrane associated rhomboid family serine protease